MIGREHHRRYGAELSAGLTILFLALPKHSLYLDVGPSPGRARRSEDGFGSLFCHLFSDALRHHRNIKDTAREPSRHLLIASDCAFGHGFRSVVRNKSSPRLKNDDLAVWSRCFTDRDSGIRPAFASRGVVQVCVYDDAVLAFAAVGGWQSLAPVVKPSAEEARYASSALDTKL